MDSIRILENFLKSLEKDEFVLYLLLFCYNFRLKTTCFSQHVGDEAGLESDQKREYNSILIGSGQLTFSH